MQEKSVVFEKSLKKTGDGNALASWIHLDAKSPEAESDLHDLAPDIDEFSAKALLDPDARPRVVMSGDHFLLVMRGINFSPNAQAEDMIAVRLWVTKQRVISLSFRPSRAIDSLSQHNDAYFKKCSTDDIVLVLYMELLRLIDGPIDSIEEDIDLLENAVMDSPSKSQRKSIAAVRKKAIMLKRNIAPQKDAINQLRLTGPEWLSEKNSRRLYESMDRVIRHLEDLDAIRERAQVIKDELVNALSDRLNRNLYVISVITAIFLPLGFLTGLFGINIGGMPGVENPDAFTFFCASLVVVIVLQVALFKWFRWF